jgi:hypothetical protein
VRFRASLQAVEALTGRCFRPRARRWLRSIPAVRRVTGVWPVPLVPWVCAREDFSPCPLSIRRLPRATSRHHGERRTSTSAPPVPSPSETFELAGRGRAGSWATKHFSCRAAVSRAGCEASRARRHGRTHACLPDLFGAARNANIDLSEESPRA